MLLIDGAKYELWTPTSEDEFEQIVNEHAQEIFGDNAIYFDKKQRLKSASRTVSIPDGYVIVIENAPSWHIVEVELSSHPPYEHIVPQVDRFINAVDYQNTRNEIVEALYSALNNGELLRVKMRQAIGRDKDIHKFLADLISQPPTITIIIEKNTEQVREAMRKYAKKSVVEFQTFKRVGAEAVHAHLFEPIFQTPRKLISLTEPAGAVITTQEVTERAAGKRVTVENLIDAGILKVGQVIYGQYRDNRYEATILRGGRIKLVHNGNEYDSPSGAGRGVLDYAVDGWTWWLTTRENGSECVLNDLRKEYRETHP